MDADSKNVVNLDLIREDKVLNFNVSSINLLIENKSIRIENLLELILGIRKDMNIKIIKTKKELLNYCYLVAGTVGVMLCDLFEIKSKKSYKFAVDLGIAMQLTNIARDILEDSRLDRVYIPKEWINISCYKIQKPSNESRAKIKYATKKLLELSEKYYRSCLKGFGYLPARTRFAILLALITYREIGIKIVKHNYSNTYKRESISAIGKLKCFMKCIIIFIFNKNIHKKNLVHNSKLHKDLDNKYAF